ncbi:MAG: NB-ARC domain-containing protein [Actinomycetota bacterium]|nr:NB-ARC domain-containing protein [Actinomycetota bacterium]
MRDLPTGTVTLLFTDIEGSTRLLEQLGSEYEQALAEHRRLIRAAVSQHEGVEVDTQGDAFLCAFSRASDAVRAAANAQRALASTPVRVRMGVHTGEPARAEEGYVGVDLHRGARVMAAGHGGQVLLSQATRDLLREEELDGIGLRDLGEHRLKDLSQPQRLFQLLVAGLPSEFPPPRTLENRPTNLPVQPTPLVGRDRELAEVASLLRREDVRLLTLTGPGGTGKTRLALQAAAELVEAYPDGVWFVNLAALTDHELVVPTIAQTLGLKEHPGESILDTVSAHVADKELLLLLDNFEQVAEAAPPLAQLLARAREPKLLVTSRAPLHLSAEREYAVRPLADEEAHALFAERAQAAKASFSLDGNRPLVAEICRRLDNLPLAIELAAARIKLLPEKALLDRLDQRLRLLTGGARDLDERQRTLRAAIEWSHNLLSEEEQTLFRRLAIFSGGRTLEAIEVVSNSAGELDVLEGVASLVDKSLIRQEETEEGEPRFVMLETIHEYARERLEESGEADELGRRHAEYFLALAEEAEPEFLGHNQSRRLREFDAELDNLRAALQWGLDAGEPELALRLATALSDYWDATGKSGEALRWVTIGLARAPAIGGELRARALLAAGTAAVRMSDGDAGERFLEESVALFREFADPSGQARSLFRLARSLELRGELERADLLADEAIELARAAGDHFALRSALNQKGTSALERVDYEQARALFEEAAAVGERVGDARNATIARINVAEAMLLAGDSQAAVSTLRELLPRVEELGDPYMNGYSLRLLGLALLRQGKPREAQAALQEAISLTVVLGERRSVTDCLLALGAVAGELSRPDQAARLWGAAEAALESASYTLYAVDRLSYERYLASTRAQLPEQAWKKAWAEGRRMSLNQAHVYADEQCMTPPDASGG